MTQFPLHLFILYCITNLKIKQLLHVTSNFYEVSCHDIFQFQLEKQHMCQNIQVSSLFIAQINRRRKLLQKPNKHVGYVEPRMFSAATLCLSSIAAL